MNWMKLSLALYLALLLPIGARLLQLHQRRRERRAWEEINIREMERRQQIREQKEDRSTKIGAGNREG